MYVDMYADMCVCVIQKTKNTFKTLMPGGNKKVTHT